MQNFLFVAFDWLSGLAFLRRIYEREKGQVKPITSLFEKETHFESFDFDSGFDALKFAKFQGGFAHSNFKLFNLPLSISCRGWFFKGVFVYVQKAKSSR